MTGIKSVVIIVAIITGIKTVVVEKPRYVVALEKHLLPHCFPTNSIQN